MILKSFSKINLSLNVNKKLKNGLHDIQSYFCLINLFDKIEVKKIKGEKDLIIFKGKFAKYIKKKNSISVSLKLLRKFNIISNYYSVIIEKNIPVFAGLGGGTSNAVFLIQYFTKKKIDKKLLNIFEKKIGSDFRLFLYRQGFVKSLNTIDGFRMKYNLHFLLIYPNIKSSTSYVYSKVSKYSVKLKGEKNKVNNKKKFIDFLLNEKNDLELIVKNENPIVKTMLANIEEQKGCYFSRMSGSGSICYGVFESKKTAKNALNSIKLKFPKFWYSVAKTI